MKLGGPQSCIGSSPFVTVLVSVGLNRQKYLPRPTTDRWLGIARIQNREKRTKNEVRSKQ
jgi:hypothetical protein